MLVLPGWVGMNIPLYFRMRVWGFALLCWPFFHTVFELDYFWIFGVFLPKGQIRFNFEVFLNLEIFTLFCMPPYFLEFSWHELGRGPRLSNWILVKPLLHLFFHWTACHIYTPDVVFG